MAYHKIIPSIGTVLFVQGAKGKFKGSLMCKVLSEGRREMRNPEECYWVTVEVISGPHKGHVAQLTLRTDTVMWF